MTAYLIKPNIRAPKFTNTSKITINNPVTPIIFCHLTSDFLRISEKKVRIDNKGKRNRVPITRTYKYGLFFIIDCNISIVSKIKKRESKKTIVIFIIFLTINYLLLIILLIFDQTDVLDKS